MGERFELTAEHVVLMRNMWVGWNGDEFGAPSIDPKRPYGNSDVLADMREILDEPETPGDALHKLHREMQTALEILLRVASVRLGVYTRRGFSEPWTRAGEPR